MDGVVLVLNQNYEPLNVCNLPRAFRLVFGEKAEVLEYDHQVIRTPRAEYRAPSVIRLQHLDPPTAPAGQALAPRGLRPRRAHLPVLRPPDARPDPRPRRAAPPRRRPHLGQPRDRLQVLQPPQGRRRRSRRRACGSPARRSSRAATSTRCSRRTSRDERNEAWRTYLFLGRTEAGPGRRPTPRSSAPSAAARSRGVRARGRSARRPRRVRRRRLAPRRAPGPTARTGTWPRTRGPSGSRALFPRRPLREPVRDGRRPPRRRRATRSRPSGPTPTTPTTGGRTRSSSATRSRRTWPGATSPSTPWPGARRGGPEGAAVSSIRYGGRADLAAAAAAGGRRSGRALRRGRPADGAGGPARGDARLRDRAADAGRDPAPRGRSASHLSGERIGAELRQAAGRRRARRSGLAADGRDRAARRDRSRSWPRSAASPRTRSPGDDLWDHTLRTVDAAPADGPVARLAALLHDIGKPATLPTATSSATTRSGRAGRRDPRAASARRARFTRAGRRTSSGTTCSATSRPGRTRPSAGSSAASGRPTVERPAATCARPTTSGAGWPADGTASTSCARRCRGAARGARRARGGRTSPSTATTSCRRSALAPGPLLGRILDELWSGSSPTRRSTSAAGSCSRLARDGRRTDDR